MTNLIILGNTNYYTFANTILAANAKAEEIFKHSFTNIFVLHSGASYIKLVENKDWIDYVESHNIKRDLFVHKIIETTKQEDIITNFVDYIEFILKGISPRLNVIVDLTNGTSLQKNLLSIALYILDIKHQYIIDVVKLQSKTEERGFLPVDILVSCYTPVPDYSSLDNIAYLNLSEMVRYKKIIETHTNKYVSMDEFYSDRSFFKDNLSHSIQLKLQGDQVQNNAIYRIAVSSISASVEDLLRLLIKKFKLTSPYGNLERMTFGDKLKTIQSEIEKKKLDNFDIQFFKKFNEFILYLRNSSTHKGETLNNIEKFKAELSVKMSFPFIEFYTDIVYSLLSASQPLTKTKSMKKLLDSDLVSGEVFYYALDGDDTGKKLEELFLSCSDENSFRKLSTNITRAIQNIAKLITDKLGKKAIVFDAGDDLLFKGNFTEELLVEMQTIYTNTTSGLTCSIGYGRSFQEVYLALKLAKSQPSKNSIFGIELFSSNTDDRQS